MKFFEEYLKYVGKSECPRQFHRWACLGMLGASVGRNSYLPFGHRPIYPNQYLLLLGAPGTRKSTAINIAIDLLEKSGYKTFAKDRTSPERFFADLSKKLIDGEEDLEALVLDSPSEVWIANGEFLDFIGRGNMDFLTALTNLYDNKPSYEHPKLHGKSVHIDKPTINILGGATVKGLGMAIPPEALGTGILSRLVLIYGDMTSVKITFPDPIVEGAEDEVVETLSKINTDCRGEITRTSQAEVLLDKIYHSYPGIEDARFADYSGRRFTHLLKLSILITISSLRTKISSEDVLIANTLLHSIEKRMPKALGEFGKSKYSDVANSIMDVLGRAIKPLSHSELWKVVAKDLSDVKDLGAIMKNLLSAEKVQILTVASKQGYLPLHRGEKEWAAGLLLEDYLPIEES